MIQGPAVVRNKAVAVGAEQWLDDLPHLIADLEHRWGIAVGPMIEGGTESYVAETTGGDGEALVLKLLIPREHDVVSDEIKVLTMANGEGCVELLKFDDALGALLMERLGPTLHDLALPIGERDEILCAAVERLWRPA